MPVRSDYLLRIIQQLTQVFARLVGLRRAGRHDEALELIDESARAHFGLGTRIALALATVDLVALLKDKHGSTLRSGVLLAELLEHEGDVRADQGAVETARPIYARALSLVLAASETPEVVEDDLVDASRMVDQLHRRLGDLVVDATELAAAARLHERAGAFALAENVHYALAARGDATGATAAARDFYERLRVLDDAALERGGLPRDEVEEGLRALAATRQPR